MLPFDTPDLAALLKKEEREIWLYGMGNGADKVLAWLDSLGLCAAGVFASDGFTRGKIFHGFTVISYSEFKESHPAGSALVLLSFGSARPEVVALFREVAACYPLYVPDMPVAGTEIFDSSFLAAHRKEFEKARETFADDASKELYDLILTAKLTGRFDLICKAVGREERELLDFSKIKSMVDLGAYNGDSAREVLAHTSLSYLLAFEPDARNFKKLTTWADTQPFEIKTVNAAAWKCGDMLHFDASGNRNAGISEKGGISVPAESPDSFLTDRTVDYVKFDVEGAEKEALYGCAKTIARDRPQLKISCYHRAGDLYEIPLLLLSLYPDCKFFLTRKLSFPVWDIDLIVRAKEIVF